MEWRAPRAAAARSQVSLPSREPLVREPQPQPVNYRPLYPEETDQGDPYLLVVPEGVEAAYRYYVYVTSDLTSRGAFPVYASNDLGTGRPLGSILVAVTVPRAYWAPCVRYVPG